MKSRKVLPWKIMPPKAPIGFPIVWWLLLDRLQPPGWVWGATGFVVAFLFVCAIIDLFTVKYIPLPPGFDGDEK